jgi:hypothetical protein
MSRAHDKDDVDDVEPPAASPAEVPGKVVVDGRGHNVWQWAKDVIEHFGIVERLENKELSLEPTQSADPVRPPSRRKDANTRAKPADPKRDR